MKKMAFTYTRGGFPFQRCAQIYLLFMLREMLIADRAPQTVTGRSSLVCNGHSTGLPPLPAASQALHAPEAFRGGTREGSRRKGRLLLSAQDRGVKTGVEASSHPIASHMQALRSAAGLPSPYLSPAWPC